jgi:hypothetical protein
MTTAEVKRIDSERKHLEGLLKDRINFNLVFSSVFLAGLSRIEEPIRFVILVFGTIVSLLISLAILRTHRLVHLALTDLGQHDPQHPYITYRRKITFPSNANSLLIFVPFALTTLFAVLTIVALVKTLPTCG